MAAKLSVPVKDWYCPNCDETARTQSTVPHTEYHGCSAMGGLALPMVRAGVRAKVELREREDYVNRAQGLVYAEGKPIMSVVTTRDDGQDCAVFAPVATGRGQSFS